MTDDTAEPKPLVEDASAEDAQVSQEGAPAEMKSAGSGALQELAEIGKTLAYALGIALVLRVLLFQPFTIPSESMEPVLLHGDYIIVSKYSYGYSRHSIPFSPRVFSGRLLERKPKRGDVIVFKLPRDGRTDYIKRLIGLPGDTVQMQDGQVILNGKPVERQLIGPIQDPGVDPRMVDQYKETLPGGKSFITFDRGPYFSEKDTTEVFVVPQDHYFFMGDNRDNSQDSRWAREASGVGFVPKENLVGKAQVVLLAWTPKVSILKPWTWFTEARPSRFFKPIK